MKMSHADPSKAKMDAEAEVFLEQARDEMARSGIRMRQSAVTTGKTQFSHWMFDDEDGRRLVNYWPTSGRWNCPLDRTGGDATPDRILRIVLRVAGNGRS